MTNAKSQFIVSADWLETHLADEDVRIVDASWYLPAQNRDARAEYEAAHILNAVFFDQDKIVDPDSDLPHTLPSPKIFAGHVGQLGLERDQTIIIYDGPGLFSAARVWWMLRLMGAENVFILDGGFDRWKAQNRPISDKAPAPAPTEFKTDYNADAAVFFDQMNAIIDMGQTQILDARAHGRFTGENPEPRAGMRGGHMPNAISLPFTELCENGSLKPLDELAQIFKAKNVDISKPIVTSCGSGVTAAVINLALASLGQTDTKLYDGSWFEWGSKPDTPIITGA